MIRMSKYNFCLLTGFLFLVTGSCKKKQYSDSSTTGPATFYFNGIINNNQVNLQAGTNNYYMVASYALDGNGVYDFTGELKDKSCPSNCANSLKIYLKDYRKYSTLATTVDSSIVTGYYSFSTPAGMASKYDLQFFDTLYNGIAQTYSWNFGDGITSTQHKPLHKYLHPGIYNVSLNIQSTTSCSSSLNNNVMFGPVGNAFQSIFGGSASGNTVNFGTSVGGIAPHVYSWNFGDGGTSTVAMPIHTYSTQGVYLVSLSVMDATGYNDVYNANIATQTATNCHLNFYPVTTTPVPNPMNLSNVTIEWHDSAGNLFTSANNSQPTGSMFQIISIDNYSNTVSGQATKKIHAKVSCTLYNGSSTVLLNGDVVFSVAHL
jgi:PKD repeat protein